MLKPSREIGLIYYFGSTSFDILTDVHLMNFTHESYNIYYNEKDRVQLLKFTWCWIIEFI